MKSGFLHIVILFMASISHDVYAFDRQMLDAVMKLKVNKKYCEAAKITSQCLTSKPTEDLTEQCLVLGEELAERCISKYMQSDIRRLLNKGRLKEANEGLVKKFDDLKLSKSTKALYGERLFISYDNDYAKRHISLFKKSNQREEMLYILVSQSSPGSKDWDQAVNLYLKEYSKSLRAKDVHCARAQDLYNRWVYREVPYRGSSHWTKREDLKSTEALSLRQDALSSYQKVLDLESKPETLNYPCYGDRVRRAVEALNSSVPADDLIFYDND